MLETREQIEGLNKAIKILRNHCKDTNNCSYCVFSFIEDEHCNCILHKKFPFELNDIKIPVLDEKEQEFLGYLVNNLKPEILTIKKEKVPNLSYERISLDGERYWLCLPMFKEGTMYKGMELGKSYKPEELEL